MNLYKITLENFNKNPKEIKAYLKTSEKPTASLAALSVVANAIINLDEFVTKQWGFNPLFFGVKQDYPDQHCAKVSESIYEFLINSKC